MRRIELWDHTNELELIKDWGHSVTSINLVIDRYYLYRQYRALPCTYMGQVPLQS